MSREFDSILDECLSQLKMGAGVEQCAARYPQHAEALLPYLSLAAAVQSVPVPLPSPAAVAANQQRMLGAVKTRATRPVAGGFLRLPRSATGRFSPGSSRASLLLRVAMAMTVLFLLLGFAAGGLVNAAEGSLPGDTLYRVKRIAEEIQLSITFDALARQQLDSRFAQQREAEVWAVLDMGREARVDFQGALSQIEDDFWTVAGLRLALDDETVTEGQPLLGATVRAEALSLADGSLRALRLQILWRPEPSATSVNPTPTPSATPTPLSPTATRTRMPAPTGTLGTADRLTSTATPAPLLVVTEEPEPTVRPQPTETIGPDPTHTLRPAPTKTEEPEFSDEPEPTKTWEPGETDHPEPTKTREPDEIDEPEPTKARGPHETDEPESTRTREPEETEETDEPEPTRTREPGETENPKPSGAVAPEPTSPPELEPTETGEPEPPHSPTAWPTDDD